MLEGLRFKVVDERSPEYGQTIVIEYVDEAYVYYLKEDGEHGQTSIAHVMHRINEGIWELVK